MSRVVVIDTGCANLSSVAAAFRRLNVEVAVTSPAAAGQDGATGRDATMVRNAARVVLPGVGAFGPAMRRLVETGMADALRERVVAGRPLLAICLGMQLLAEASDEAPGVEGLGIVPTRVRRFTGDVRVPQLGWNQVSARGVLVRDGFAYFANAFHLPSIAAEWSPSTAVHGAPFVAAIERDALLACQFHPELSGAWGSDLIKRWCITC